MPFEGPIVKRSIEFNVRSAPLPLRWNAFGMLIAGAILLILTVLGIYAYFVFGTEAPNMDTTKTILFMITIFGFLSLAFLTVGGLLLQHSSTVIDKDLANRGGLDSTITYPDGSTQTMTSSALPLFKWTGLILSTIGLVMIAGGFYVLTFVAVMLKAGIIIYLFGMGAFFGLLGLFFIHYSHRILRAQRRCPV